MRLGTDRTVFELLNNVGVVRRSVLRQLPEQDEAKDCANNADQLNNREEYVDWDQQPPAPMQGILDGRDRLLADHGDTSCGVGTWRTGCVL